MSVYWIKYRGTRFPVRRGETILGRSPYCTIVISNGLVSREHCALRLTAEGLQIVDLGSTNGTKVNGEPIEAIRLLDSGDVIAIGTDLLEVLVVDPAERRGSDSTRRSKVDAEPAEAPPEDLDTLTYRGTLDLVETLVSSAAESQAPILIVPTIQKAIDEVMSQIAKQGILPTSPQATRIAAVAERVAGWATDRSLDEWKDKVLTGLQGQDP